MADYLTRLAERALGLAEVAMPVIAPVFAPDPALPDAWEVGADLPQSEPLAKETTGFMTSPTVNGAAARRQEPAERGPEEGSDLPAPVDTDSTPGRLLTEASNPLRAEKPDPRQSQLDHHTKGLAAAAHSSEVRLDGAAPSSSPPVPNPTQSRIAECAAPVQLDGQEDLTPASTMADSVPTRPTEQMDPVSTTPYRFDPTTPAKSEDAAEDLRPLVLSPRSQLRRGTEEAQPSAPQVRVSVGRIEVRAVFPAAEPPPRRVETASPRLSLEEYLRTQHRRRS